MFPGPAPTGPGSLRPECEHHLPEHRRHSRPRTMFCRSRAEADRFHAFRQEWNSSLTDLCQRVQRPYAFAAAIYRIGPDASDRRDRNFCLCAHDRCNMSENDACTRRPCNLKANRILTLWNTDAYLWSSVQPSVPPGRNMNQEVMNT